MPEDSQFDELLERVRRGDPDAAYELVRQYELDIRVAVRTRLSDPALRQQFDSLDVCQSVLASFFLRAAAGQYDLREPGQLVALLTQMARNKLAMHARSQYQQRRDVRRMTNMADGLASHPDRTAGPARQALDRDLLHRAYTLMNPEVREIADHRIRGRNWADIAESLGGTPDARRQQYWRAMDNIAQSLEIE